MSPAIHDPISIASYTSEANTSTARPHVSVSHAVTAGSGESSEGHATITVDSSAIHVIDLSASHPLASYTLGPDTRYSCRAVSRKSNKSLETYAVIEKSPFLESDQGGQTIWAWTTSFKDPVVSVLDRQTSVFESRIHAIYAPRSLPSMLLLVFATGTAATVSSDPLALRSSTIDGAKLEGATILKTFVFSRQRCPFVLVNVAVVVVTVLHAEVNDHELVIKVSAFREDGSVDLSACDEVKIPKVDGRTIRDISCDHHGSFTILSNHLQWTFYTLARSLDEPLTIASHTTPLHLDPTKFSLSTRTAYPSSALPTSLSACILHLNTTHVLLAGVSASSPTVELLLWDVQYHVLLARQSIPLPRAGTAYLQLSKGDDGHALLVITPQAKPTKSSSSGDEPSSVVMIPISVPPSSSLLEALTNGASKGQEWLRIPESEVVADGMSVAERQALQKMVAASTKEDVNAVLVAYQHKAEQDFSSGFVGEACRLFLGSASQAEASGLTSIKWFLEHGLLSQTHGEGEMGLIGLLIEHKKWSLVMAGLDHIRDISEDVIVKTLQLVLGAHLQSHPLPSQTTQDGMDVDVKAFDLATITMKQRDDVPPTLMAYLARFIHYPATPGPLRAALKKHISLDGVTVLLLALHKLLEQASLQIAVIPPPESSQKKSQFALVLDFLQNILDTFLLFVLTNAAAQDALLSIMRIVDRATEVDALAQMLRGPLEPFARAQTQRAIKERAHLTISGKDEHAQKLKARSARHREADAKVLIYQVETLRL